MNTQERPDYITINADHSITVTLSREYTIDGASRSTITLREPTAGDQKNYMPTSQNITERQAADLEGKLLSGLADEVAPDALDKLALRDYRRVQKAFSFFLD